LPLNFREAPLVRNERLTIQVVDTIESMRDVFSGLLDLYLSTLSSRMNEVMKVFTIMVTLLLP